MPYDPVATRAVIEQAGLAPRSQEMFEHWLSLWQGNELPVLEDFAAERVPKLSPNILIFNVVPDSSVTVKFAGSNFTRSGSGWQLGTDWLNSAPPKTRDSRLRRFSASARGAIVRGIPEAILKSEHAYFYEAVHFPFRPGADGTTPVLVYIDWDPPNNENMPVPANERANLPIVTEIFPIPRNAASSASGSIPARPAEAERAKIMSRAAMRFLLNLAGDIIVGSESSNMDPIDYFLAISVGAANVSHIDSDLALSRQYSGLIEPDYMRRGISRAAISRATGLPLETVRRRINKMIALDVLIERKDGVIVSANNPLKLGTRFDRMHKHAQLIDGLFRDLKARGIKIE
jgi:hypothetical protein